MPELPEVETIVRVLSKHLIGLKIISGKLLSLQVCKDKEITDLETLKDLRIKDVRRRGKFILIDLERNITMLFHLGMTGQLYLSPPHDPIDRHMHFKLDFAECPYELRFRDVRRLGCLALIPTDEAFSDRRLRQLGPEPLEIEFPNFVSHFGGRRGRLKSLLLEQRFISGIGNIYADEILFRAKLHPLLPASLLEKSHLKRLWRAMREVLKQAIEYRGSTIRNYVNGETRPGKYQSFHRVYGKEACPCSVCKTRIERIKINGRSAHFCPNCQALKRED